MYSISTDRENALIEARLGGLLSVEETAGYIAEIKRQFVLNQLHHYAMVIDVTACPIQPQESVRAMAEHMARMPKARALAIVTGSSLSRMQVRRLFTQPYARIVDTIAEGRAWVLSGVEPSAHAGAPAV